MAEDDIDVMMQWYDRFIESVSQIAMCADEQKTKLSGFIVTDELASAFCDIGMVYAKKLLECGWITQEQFSFAERIVQKFDDMSQEKDLWTEQAFLQCEEWEICREMGRRLLDTLEK